MRASRNGIIDIPSAAEEKDLGRICLCLSLDTETVNYDHYLRLGGALNFELSLKKKKIYIYNWVGH